MGILTKLYKLLTDVDEKLEKPQEQAIIARDSGGYDAAFHERLRERAIADLFSDTGSRVASSFTEAVRGGFRDGGHLMNLAAADALDISRQMGLESPHWHTLDEADGTVTARAHYPDGRSFVIGEASL